MVSPDDEAIGSMVETALFSQLFHIPDNKSLHYARWKQGEIDIVDLNEEQKVTNAMEIKWSDRYFQNTQELNHLIDFCHTHSLSKVLITSRTDQGTKTRKNVNLIFAPSSRCCYRLGKNIILGRIKEFLDANAFGEAFKE